MKKFQTLSSRAVLLMCAVWAVLTFGGMLTNGQSYFFLGLISAWLGVQNIILLNMGQKTGEMPDKLAYHVKQKGERGGIIRHGAKVLYAYANCTVPLVTVIMRKAYGGAYIAMGSKDLCADVVYAWPTAEIAVMGAEGAAKIIYKKELASAADPQAKFRELAEDYRQKFSNPYQAAESDIITDVISPAETRYKVALSLRSLLTKRVARPSKKSGLSPL